MERSNNELVATWGNTLTPERTRVRPRVLGFMLSFACKRFHRVVLEPGASSRSSGQGLDAEDRALLEKVRAGFETVDELYDTSDLDAYCHYIAPVARASRLSEMPPTMTTLNCSGRGLVIQFAHLVRIMG